MKGKLKTELLELLNQKISPFNFKLVKKMDWFARKGSTSQYFQLSFYNSSSGYTIEPALAIRIEKVEEIFHSVSGFEPQYQKYTPTINPFIAALKNRSDFQFSLETTDDCKIVSEALFRIFRDDALPFFDDNSSIDRVDKLLNDNPNEDSIYYSYYLRCFHGAIVAKLSKRENFDYVAETYKKNLATFCDSYYLRDFNKLLTRLEKFSGKDLV